MIYEIWCNGKLHYTRPEGHPDIQEALDLIETQKRLYGSASYEVRPTPLAPDTAKAEPYFDPELPEEYIEGVIYHQKRRAGKA